MISVGVDVSKGKSTVCILKPYGEIVCCPFEVLHMEKELDALDALLNKLNGEIRIVMEATGIYHLPVLTFLHEKGYFVSVINPYAMKKYAKDNSIRGAKTDKLDSIMIANYGIEKWFKLKRYAGDEEIYAELKLLGRRYRYYMELHVKALQELTHILDYVMPGIKKMFNSWNEANGKDKLSDFVERFWHFDLITSMSLEEFTEKYLAWAKEKKYHRSKSKAETVYELASSGIPTLSSGTPSTKMLVQEAVSVLRTVDSSLTLILTRMQALAKSLPEYSTVREMGGVGDVLAVKLIAEIGDVRTVFANPRSDIAKKLIMPQGELPVTSEHGKKIRIIYNGENSSKSLLADMILKCNTPVNILHADTKDIDGKAYGQILVQLPDDDTSAEKITAYLKANSVTYSQV